MTDLPRVEAPPWMPSPTDWLWLPGVLCGGKLQKIPGSTKKNSWLISGVYVCSACPNDKSERGLATPSLTYCFPTMVAEMCQLLIAKRTLKINFSWGPRESSSARVPIVRLTNHPHSGSYPRASLSCVPKKLLSLLHLSSLNVISSAYNRPPFSFGQDTTNYKIG